jgi:hypothetical protein
MRSLSVAALFTVAMLHASVGAAQTCLGLPAFTAGSVHINVSAEFPDSASAYVIGVGAGRHNNLFGNLGGGQISYEGLEEKSTLAFLELGYQLPVGRLQICPIAGGYFGVGPDDDAIGLKVTSRSAAAGIALGAPVRLGFLTLVPNAAFKYDYLSVKFDEVDVGTLTETYSGQTVDVALALLLGRRFSIQPIAHLPVGGDDGAETSYGVFASFALGWRSR